MQSYYRHIKILWKILRRLLLVLKKSTFFNETTYEFIPELWTTDVIVCSFLAIASLYLLTALVYYFCKNKKKTSSVEEFLLLSSERKYRLLSIHTCISIGFVSIFHHACSIGSLTLAGKVAYNNLSLSEKTTICEFLPRFIVTAYGFGIDLVMLFLWLRQRTFYVHSSLEMKFLKLWNLSITLH